ncbi:3'-5' exonuclease domain-containing protein 2 [Pseudoalteromonas sp. C2R02]|uniref:3'-5' exonuclease n=1 Tax=Pseudoalteromonas sp. C2R02 TaxID=2841565 RepID=UPI001C0A4432|nr:3'-5' exonuclease [Pseudoalteromonas sp. C2R02]MBU2970783.1 3'-5' exonuclease domain-containing protein 2 [Pseudoalteromonas sp. C2R02]
MQRPTKEQIRELPLYSGISLVNIKIIENEQDAVEALKQLIHEPCLGFDTESKPIFRKGAVSPGPTLIQLSTSSKAFLFPTKFSAALAAANEILANPNIKKVGFGLKGDNKELRSKFNINILNTEDLSVKLKNLVGDKNQIGAQAAVAMVLKSRLAKGAQMSNWGAYPLNKNQILYAANDAHCAICIEQSLASFKN